MISQIKEIEDQLKEKSSQKVRESFQKFIPNSQDVYGVRVPELNQLAKKYKNYGFDLVENLWQAGSFEERLLASKILAEISKLNPDLTLQLIEDFSKEIIDWAVCDTLGQQSTKKIAELKKKEILNLSKRLVNSENFWQRRLSLVLVENFKNDKNCKKEIINLMKKLENDSEPYVQKAVRWTKNNLAKIR